MIYSQITMKNIILSGVRPSGRPHIGNYFGAMRQFVEMQNEHTDAAKFFMVADLHTLDANKGENMRQASLDIILDYLAIGIDPKKSTLFIQSSVPAHSELAMIFSYLMTVPYLMRGHLYKDAEAKGKEVLAGTFLYPVLMAADILLYGTTHVPVGIDNKQHVEIARDAVRKFNHEYGEYFVEPKEILIEDSQLVPGIDGKKMSKSYGNTIPLFSTRGEIQKLVMSIVTDSGSDVPTHVYNIHKLLRTEAELAPIYEMHKGKYKALKETLIEDLDAFIKPMRERREKLAKNMKAILKVVEKGNKNANKVALKRIREIKKLCGLSA